ncbi:MAG: M56 family metallopeptidase [Bacteroidota bacterium]
MIPYILHVSLLISLSFVFYKAFLESETFFKFNRLLLIVCIGLAFYLPTVMVPQHLTLRQDIVQEVELSYFNIEKASKEVAVAPPHFEANTTPPVIEHSIHRNTPQIDKAKASSSVFASLDWPAILWYAYLIGIAVFSLNLLIQLIVLLYQIFTNPSIKDGKFRIVELEADKAPYSFMNCIFINPTKYDWETYNQILEHEKIHIQQFHSIDMIIAEIIVVLQWFNPLAWYYRKAVENNLEYLTDHAMLNKGTEKEPYQMNLLKVSVPHYPIGMAMNYNQSFLKKRIKMMNAKKSSVRTSWKYLALIPLFGLSLACFNAVHVAAKELRFKPVDFAQHVLEESTTQAITIEDEVETKVTSERVADKAIQESKKPLSSSTITSISGTLPFEMKGVWQAEIDGNIVCVRFDNSDFSKNMYWISSECFEKSEFSSLPTTESSFTLERDAGIVTFKGEFDGNEGLGRYVFEYKKSFADFLKNQGIDGTVKDETMFHFFLADFDQAFVRNLKQKGYSRLNMKNLKKLAIHKVDQDYIDDMASIGFDDLSLEELVKGKIHNVDPAYVKEINSVGYEGISFNDYVKFAIHNVDADFVKSLKAAGYDNVSADKIRQAAIHNVSPEYIEELSDIGFKANDLDQVIKFAIHNVDTELVQSLQDAGFSNLDAEDITRAAIHNVDKDYVKELEGAGYKLTDIDDVIKFAIHNVDAELVESLADAGFPNLSAKNITDAAIHNVTPRYIKEIEDAGYEMQSMDDLIHFKIHNVNARFIKSLNDAGYDNISAKDIRSAAIHGLDADYIKRLEATGMDLPDIDKLIRFATHNVNPSFISDMADLGYKDLSADELIKARIHNIDASFVKGFNELGYKDIPMDDVIKLKIHNVTPQFIKTANAKGYKDLSLDEYKKLKIHGLVKD